MLWRSRATTGRPRWFGGEGTAEAGGACQKPDRHESLLQALQRVIINTELRRHRKVRLGVVIFAIAFDVAMSSRNSLIFRLDHRHVPGGLRTQSSRNELSTRNGGHLDRINTESEGAKLISSAKTHPQSTDVWR